jgi:ParB family chromosome partitioning protein
MQEAIYQDVALDELDVSPHNVRDTAIMDELDDLVESLRIYHLLEPIVVQKKPNGRYEILIGQRRYLAAKRLNWPTIPARVLAKPLDDVDAALLSFTENVQRRELEREDKAKAAEYLKRRLGSAKAVADRLGVSERTVYRWLGYAAVPDSLKALVHTGRITPEQVTRLSTTMPDEESALAVAQRIVEVNPPRPARRRILEAAETMPDSSPDEIFALADQTRTPLRINFVLTPRYEDAIRRAAKDLGMDHNDVAHDATVDWLKANQY